MLYSLAFLPALASAAEGPSPHPRIQRYTVEDGLSQGSVTAIVQDHLGFIWLGTHDGLNRFDGVEFRVFRHAPGDSTSLSNSWITCLVEDQQRRLWVGTRRGLNRFDRRTETFTRVSLPAESPDRGADLIITCVYESRHDSAGLLWASDRVLHVLDPSLGRSDPVPWRIAPGGPLLGSVTGMEADAGGRLWIAVQSTLFAVDPRTMSMTGRFDAGGPILCLTAARKSHANGLWVGTDSGLLRYDPGGPTSTRITGGSVGALLEDSSGNLWMVEDGRLYRFAAGQSDSGGPAPVPLGGAHASGLQPEAYATVLHLDRSGALWVGTFHGIYRLSQFSSGFTKYHKEGGGAGPAPGFVMPILEDRQGNVWFGTLKDGVSILTAGAATQFESLRHDPREANSLCLDNVRSLAEDRRGYIWLGLGGALARYDPLRKAWTCYRRLEAGDTLNLWPEALCASREGVIWIGASPSSLVRMDPEQDPPHFLRLALRDPEDTSFMPDDINVLAEDQAGIIWAGTDVGLFALDPRTFELTRFAHDPNEITTLSHDQVWSICEDPERADVLWIGTSQGLNRLHKTSGAVQRHLRQPGFPNDFVYGILRDDWGRLWLSTNLGLTCLDARKPEGRQFKNYDVSDGLSGNEFNRRSYCRLRSGEFLFGGTDGVTRFNPLQLRDNTHLPPVVLTSFSVFGAERVLDEDLSSLHRLELSHAEDVFAFEFAALDYTNAAKNQYAYKMEGFDRDWVYCGTQRFASYTHLDPGDYVFRVKAANNDGYWNEEGTAVRVRITPPYWERWWFRLVGLGAVLALLAGAYRRRVRLLLREKQLQRDFSARLLDSQEAERKRIASELHDSLGQDLLVIRNRALLGLKEAAGSQVRHQLDQICAVATQSIGHVREISHGLRPYQIDRLGLAKAMRSLVEGLASSVQFSVDLEPIDDALSPEQAIHVYRMVQEGVSNILKHAEATQGRVAIAREGGRLRIVISDNGKGTGAASLEEASGRGGLGLRGISERAKALNGQATMESTARGGTMLIITLPCRVGSS